WSTAITGWPAQIARNIERHTPSFELQFGSLAFLVGTVATAAWVALITWRMRAHPAALWRGTMLSAGGVLVSWILLNTLWLPSIDYARSSRPVAAAISQALEDEGSGACIRTRNLAVAQRASLAVLEGLVFSFDASCPLMLQQTTQSASQAPLPAGTRVLWQGARPSDRQELYRLMRITPQTD